MARYIFFSILTLNNELVKAADLIKNAETSRRLERLAQVRNQSKQLSQTVSKNVRVAERNALKEMSNTLTRVR